jgi:predicted CXXCH cytochrome family protein
MALTAPGPEHCTACHAFVEVLSHPVGTVAAGAVPPQLPLESGQVVCTTCHTVVAHEGRGTGLMLRTQDGQLCALCHADSANGATAHTSDVFRAHPQPSTPLTMLGEALNPGSVNCLTCHDGMSAQAAEPHIAAQARAAGTPPGHAGLVYRATSEEPTCGGLVDMARLDQRVRLFDQRVQCESCHSVYARNRYLLVLDNTRSGLCTSCHVR